jgi:DNA-binding MarR family transcriptional regulator
MNSPDHPGGLRSASQDDQLCFALHLAADAVMKSLSPHLREMGLSFTQYVVMLALWREGPLTIRDLVQRSHATRGQIEHATDRLEAADLVVRIRCESDPAMIRVAPTRAGAELEDVAARAQQSVACRSGLGVEQIAALRATLLALADTLSGEGAVSKS